MSWIPRGRPGRKVIDHHRLFMGEHGARACGSTPGLERRHHRAFRVTDPDEVLRLMLKNLSARRRKGEETRAPELDREAVSV
jgi:hypothetical protein